VLRAAAEQAVLHNERSPRGITALGGRGTPGAFID